MGRFSRPILHLLIVLLGAAAFMASMLPMPSQAARLSDIGEFKAAQAAGKPILVAVTASWCPTCRVQQSILQRFEAEFPQLLVFDVDFDNSPDMLRQFRVRFQSTLIVFKGDREVGRSVGDTDAARIKALLSRGLGE